MVFTDKRSVFIVVIPERYASFRYFNFRYYSFVLFILTVSLEEDRITGPGAKHKGVKQRRNRRVHYKAP